MKETLDVAKLRKLQKDLPARVLAAVQALRLAELSLAQLLTKRAAGQATRGFEVAGARMALSKASRDVEDLQRIEGALPAMLESVSLIPVIAHADVDDQRDVELGDVLH